MKNKHKLMLERNYTMVINKIAEEKEGFCNVEVDISDEEFLFIAKKAHEKNVSFNQFVNDLLWEEIERREQQQQQKEAQEFQEIEKEFLEDDERAIEDFIQFWEHGSFSFIFLKNQETENFKFYDSFINAFKRDLLKKFTKRL